METRINQPLLVPPSESISNVLQVSAEITIKFIMKVGLKRAESTGKLSKMFLVEDER